MEQGEIAPEERIIDFLSSRMDELVDGLIASYIARFPQSRSSSLSKGSLDRWTREEIDELFCALRQESVEPRSNLLYTGDLAKGVSDIITPLANYIETKMIVGKWVTGFLWENYDASPRDIQKACQLIETATLRLMRGNLDEFKETALVSGNLLRYWSNPLNVASHGREEAHSARISGIGSLTPQEHKVLLLAVKGRTNGEIASKLGVAQNTVKNHLAHIYAKMGVGNRTELTSEYLQQSGKASS